MSFEDLNKEEIRLIKEYKTYNKDFGYNLTEGGDRPVFSDETRKKLIQQ